MKMNSGFLKLFYLLEFLSLVKTSIKLPKPETWVFSLTILSLPRFPHPVLHFMLLLEVSLEASRSPHFLNNYPFPPSWIWMIATVPNCISRLEPSQCAPNCSQNVLSKMQISLCLNWLKSFRGSPCTCSCCRMPSCPAPPLVSRSRSPIMVY